MFSHVHNQSMRVLNLVDGVGKALCRITVSDSRGINFIFKEMFTSNVIVKKHA